MLGLPVNPGEYGSVTFGMCRSDCRHRSESRSDGPEHITRASELSFYRPDL